MARLWSSSFGTRTDNKTRSSGTEQGEDADFDTLGKETQEETMRSGNDNHNSRKTPRSEKIWNKRRDMTTKPDMKN